MKTKYNKIHIKYIRVSGKIPTTYHRILYRHRNHWIVIQHLQNSHNIIVKINSF